MVTVDEFTQAERERIGLRLNKLRCERGITLRELGDRCGITFQSINKIEGGKYTVGIGVLSRIAAAMGCSIEIVDDVGNF